jgi:hypothetical protein
MDEAERQGMDEVDGQGMDEVGQGMDEVEEPEIDAAAHPTRATVVHRGELLSAASALSLLLAMFLLNWYGVAGVPDPSAARPAISSAENAWDGLPVVRWVVLLTIAVTLGSVILHASQRSHGTRTDTSIAVTTLGSLTGVLLTYRVLISLPAANEVIDQKFGALLGLACAVGIALGGYESMQERRDRTQPAQRRSRSRLAARRRARE